MKRDEKQLGAAISQVRSAVKSHSRLNGPWPVGKRPETSTRSLVQCKTPKASSPHPTTSSHTKTPVAPAAYRPQPVPKVLQLRKAVGRGPAKGAPTPSIYKGQPAARVLQPKQTAKTAPAKPGDAKVAAAARPSALLPGRVRPARFGPISNSIQRADTKRTAVVPWQQRQATEESNWKSRKTAGRHIPEVDIKLAGGEGEMYAIAYVAGIFQGSEIPIPGEFTTGLHAEMAALQNACAQGYRLDQVQRVVIGKEPCHRCAVVLNALGLSGRTMYKVSGQKEYNTWGFPDLTNWNLSPAQLLNLASPTSQSSQELVAHFRGTKWW